MQLFTRLKTLFKQSIKTNNYQIKKNDYRPNQKSSRAIRITPKL